MAERKKNEKVGGVSGVAGMVEKESRAAKGAGKSAAVGAGADEAANEADAESADGTSAESNPTGSAGVEAAGSAGNGRGTKTANNAGNGGGAETKGFGDNDAGVQGESTEAAEDPDTRYMRLAADFQNFKKRTEKEKSDIYAYANEKFASDLLEVIDNFERAIAQDSADGVDRKFIEGMGLIMDQLVNVLSRNDIEEIDALGEEFDPNLHHAVQMILSEEYASGRVANVIQKGYRMKDRVIRPSMVVVAQ